MPKSAQTSDPTGVASATSRHDQNQGRLKIVGLGGTLRSGSATERALGHALRRAEALGAVTELLGEPLLSRLPMFNAQPGSAHETQIKLSDAIRGADALIIASPAYHGSISGVIKNALDTLELTRRDAAPYLTDMAVGVIVLADGWQAAGTALNALRGVVHALRGWPTPFGAALNGAALRFDDDGQCLEAASADQLDLVAWQVVEFARMRAAASKTQPAMERRGHFGSGARSGGPAARAH
jgi:FMN reductase